MRCTNQILSYIFIVLAAASVSSCKDKPVYRIGVSQCSSDDWRRKMNDEMLREMMFHDDATIEIRSADDDNDRQIADIRYFADNGFDIIIASPNEAEPLTGVIKEVYESGTPVLLFDRSVHGDAFTAFQGADNRAIGHAAADLAHSYAPEGARIIEITGRQGSTPAEQRAAGFEEVVASEPAMEIVATACGNWTAGDAAAVADSLLALHPNTNIIYAHNDRMAIAAAEAARRRGMDGIRIIGIDAAPEIGIKAVADSVIDATFLYPTDGYGIIRKALDILGGKPYERMSYLGGSGMVDLSNAEIILRQNDELKEETSKIVDLKSQVDIYWTKHSAQTALLYVAGALIGVLFLLMFVVMRVYWVRRRHQSILSEKNALLQQQRDKMVALNEQIREAAQSKLNFFTNVSHDLRTPLTLISGPVDQIAGAPNLSDDQRAMMQLAKKNVKVLMRLINQILDFRKLENGKLDLNLSETDIAAMLREWCDSFRIISVSRDIRFTTDIPADGIIVAAIDVDKVERVMFNLISNAFKYTPANGSINVRLGLSGDSIVIKVTDTGQGIAAEDLSLIFERFFQVDKVHPNGSGIGLSLAKAFVELHSGTLTAESEPGKGSVFTVALPVRHIDGEVQTSGSGITAQDVQLELGEVAPAATADGGGKPVVLVIDDNADLRTLVANVLSSGYEVMTAPDGASGMKLAARHVPDLIICDVMMPGIDGMECCRRLKSGQPTSHIPVLMLTACSLDEQRAQGYECGADGYLSKPFNADVLKARCKSLIDNRRLIKSIWQTGVSVLPADNHEGARATVNDGIGPVDSEFYARFCSIVDKNIADTELSVDGIASQMGLGRTQFYRKIKALTNYSPVELLRNMRLARARTMLTSTEKSVAEIAYATGFSTPAYFGKCYKDRYGETPTEIRDHLS